MRDLPIDARECGQGEFMLSGCIHELCDARLCRLCPTHPSPPLPPQLPCGHKYCKSCVEELRQKGVDKSCPLCRKPLPPGPEKLFDLGYGIYAKIKGAIDRSRPGVDSRTPWPALSTEQQGEMDQAVAMLREAADQGHTEAQAYCGDLYGFGSGVTKDDRLAFVYCENSFFEHFAWIFEVRRVADPTHDQTNRERYRAMRLLRLRTRRISDPRLLI